MVFNFAEPGAMSCGELADAGWFEPPGNICGLPGVWMGLADARVSEAAALALEDNLLAGRDVVGFVLRSRRLSLSPDLFLHEWTASR